MMLPPPDTHCEKCGAEYKNIGHPLKPGVIMMRTCKCVFIPVQVQNGTMWMKSLAPAPLPRMPVRRKVKKGFWAFLKRLLRLT